MGDPGEGRIRLYPEFKEQGRWYEMKSQRQRPDCTGVWGSITRVGILFLFIYLRSLFSSVPTSYGASQARGRIGDAAAVLHHSHSNARSRPCL